MEGNWTFDYKKNALSPPWIPNCSAFRIPLYRWCSMNLYNSCIFSRIKNWANFLPWTWQIPPSLWLKKPPNFTAAPLDIQLPVQMGIMVDSYSEAATGETWTCCSTKENNIIIL